MFNDKLSFFKIGNDFRNLFLRLNPVFFEEDGIEVNTKSDQTLVSTIDLKLDEDITKFIATVSSDPILSEETIKQWPPQEKSFWLIDPLDGTQNRLLGLPTFGSMGCWIKAGRVEFCFFFLPVQQLASADGFYFAGRDQGAWQIINARTEKIYVSNQPELTESVFMIEGPSKRHFNSALIRGVIQQAKRVRPSLSFCWSATRVALGTKLHCPADGVVSYKNKPWDNLPCCLLIEEANGRVTDFNNRPWSLENCESLVFANPDLHSRVLKLNDQP